MLTKFIKVDIVIFSFLLPLLGPDGGHTPTDDASCQCVLHRNNELNQVRPQYLSETEVSGSLPSVSNLEIPIYNSVSPSKKRKGGGEI